MIDKLMELRSEALENELEAINSKDQIKAVQWQQIGIKIQKIIQIVNRVEE